MSRPAPLDSLLLSRRQALWRMAVLMGGAFAGADALLRGQSLAEGKALPAVSAQDQALFDVIAGTILPRTHTPGAEAAGVGAFMAVYLPDCLREREHRIFLDGLAKVSDRSRREYAAAFAEATPGQRLGLLNEVENERKAYDLAKAPSDPPHYFTLMKVVAVLGFFSSKLGATEVVHYIEVPGSFNGDVPYRKGQGAWY